MRESGSEIKIVEILLFSISTVLGRTKYICMYEVQNTYCIISAQVMFALNTILFVLIVEVTICIAQ